MLADLLVGASTNPPPLLSKRLSASMMNRPPPLLTPFAVARTAYGFFEGPLVIRDHLVRQLHRYGCCTVTNFRDFGFGIDRRSNLPRPRTSRSSRR